jgi:hypothetical protein
MAAIAPVGSLTERVASTTAIIPAAFAGSRPGV